MTRWNKPILSALIASAMALSANQAQAAEGCYIPMTEQRPVDLVDDGTIRITAEQSESKGRDYIKLQGDVELTHGGRLLKAQQAEYDKAGNKIRADGGIELTEDTLILHGDTAEIDIGGESASITGGEYQIMGQPGRGYADEIEITGREKIILENASYTTCPPGSDDWLIRASRIGLLPEENEGYAKHMRLEVAGVPVLYLPYINFPLGERKTGLLAPSFGSSNTTGDEIQAPFYWNIAPDRDATLTVRHMSMRGTQLQTELRYLNPNNYGQFNFEVLPDDEIQQQDRGYFDYQHHGNWDSWQLNMDLKQVSDINYHRELSSHRDEVSASVLQRSVMASYHQEQLHFEAAVVDFQLLDETLDAGQHPYSQQPRLNLGYNMSVVEHLQLSFEGEWVHFQRDDSLTAARLDLAPAISMPWIGRAGYLIPRLAIHDTRYWLKDQLPASEENPSRQQPITSIDSGLWFDKEWGKGLRQTLEPRLYYLYIPYRQQEQLVRDQNGNQVLFDTAENEFNFENIFSGNRYTGVDRIGDAKQLALALGSRLYNDQGEQLLHLRIGQIYYIDIPKLTLPNEQPLTREQSNLLAELDGRIGDRWQAGAFAEWSNQEDQLETARASLVYQSDIKRRISLGLNYRRGSVKQGTLQARWPFASYWSVMTDITHSFMEGKTRNATLGVEYEDCCWSVRIASRRYISDNDGTFNNAFAIQFELKGLASVGSKISGFAETGTRNLTDVEN
jgi:LPS-assembly protein